MLGVLQKNIDKENISHFMVIFNGTAERVSTSDGLYVMEQSVYTCASHNITIYAVDNCGRNGQPRSHVVTVVSNQDSTFDHIIVEGTYTYHHIISFKT